MRGFVAAVRGIGPLTQPDRVVFADGSEEEYQRLADQLVELLLDGKIPVKPPIDDPESLTP